MAQVMNPEAKEDKTIDNVLGTLSIYNTITGIRAKNINSSISASTTISMLGTSITLSAMSPMQRRRVYGPS